MIAHADPDRLLIYLVSLSGVYTVSRWKGLGRYHEGRGLPSLGLSVIACFVFTPIALVAQDMLLLTFVGTWCVTHSLIFLFEVDGRVRWLTVPACAVACVIALSAAFQTGRPSMLWLAAAVALLSNVMESLRWADVRVSSAMLLICLLVSVFSVTPNTTLEIASISSGVLAVLVFTRTLSEDVDQSTRRM